EKQRLMNYFELDEDQEALKDIIIDVLEIQDESYATNAAIAEVLAKVDRDLFVQINDTIGVITTRKNKTLKLWLQIACVAAVLALVYTGVYFFNNQSEKVTAVSKIAVHDVKPGDFGATLTLANGRKISLANA